MPVTVRNWLVLPQMPELHLSLFGFSPTWANPFCWRSGTEVDPLGPQYWLQILLIFETIPGTTEPPRPRGTPPVCLLELRSPQCAPQLVVLGSGQKEFAGEEALRR